MACKDFILAESGQVEEILSVHTENMSRAHQCKSKDDALLDAIMAFPEE
jgi:hypothetical protein